MRNNIIAIFMLISLLSINLKAEDSLSVTKSVIFGALATGGVVSSFTFQTNEYWQDPAPFHVMDWEMEYDDALLADKFGHFYFSYSLANSFAKMSEWTGLNKETATWIGSGISLLYQTYVEIYDGYSDGLSYLGFSRGDMIANVLGSSYNVAMYYYPILEHFKPKISYYPYTTKDYRSVFTDYNATNHWISVDVAGLLGYDDNLFPGIFALALGHSVKGINRHGSGVHELYLGLDINWNYFNQFDVVKNSYYLQLLINLFEKYKVPLPAIRLTNGVDAFLIR